MRRERGKQVVGWARLIASLRNCQPLMVGRDLDGAVVVSVERVWMGAQSSVNGPSLRPIVLKRLTIASNRLLASKSPYLRPYLRQMLKRILELRGRLA